jgi:hypothetical protein
MAAQTISSMIFFIVFELGGWMLPIIFQIYSLAFVKHGNAEKLYWIVYFSESVCIIAPDK